eukprot:2335168-Alexandrium_andersonii.AAC.1
MPIPMTRIGFRTTLRALYRITTCGSHPNSHHRCEPCLRAFDGSAFSERTRGALHESLVGVDT